MHDVSGIQNLQQARIQNTFDSYFRVLELQISVRKVQLDLFQMENIVIQFWVDRDDEILVEVGKLGSRAPKRDAINYGSSNDRNLNQDSHELLKILFENAIILKCRHPIESESLILFANQAGLKVNIALLQVIWRLWHTNECHLNVVKFIL